MALLLVVANADIPDREETDYCAMFGEDDVQGRTYALMTGNKVYYLSS